MASSSNNAEGTTYRALHLAMPMIIVGAVLTAIALVLSISGSTVGGIGIAGVLLLIMGLWKHNGDYISLYPDHLTAKVAPAAGRKALLYSEILMATRKGSRLTVEYRPHTDSPSSKARRLTLRINELMTDQREVFVEQFRSKLPSGVFKDA